MAGGTEFDPVLTWQKLISQWERKINEISANISTTDEFSGTMAQTTKLTMAARKAFDDSMEKWLVSMQVATHPQIEGITERLDRIEEHLQAISAVLVQDSYRQGNTRVAEPKRTKKPAEKEA